MAGCQQETGRTRDRRNQAKQLHCCTVPAVAQADAMSALLILHACAKGEK